MKAAKEIERDYQLELEKVKKLNAELQLIRSENQKLSNKYLDEKKKSDQLKMHFKEQLRQIYLETERLRYIYQIHGLLNAKQHEVDRMKKALNSVSREHPERREIEVMVKSHIVERDELRSMIASAEARFEAQLEKIQKLTDNFSDPEIVEPQSEGSGKSPGSTMRIPEH